MNRIFSIGSILLALAVLAACGGEPSKTQSLKGVVQFTKGKALLVRGPNREVLKVGTIIREGDLIRTGKDAIVIAQLSNKAAEVEIQPETEFRLEELKPGSKKLVLEKGNLWLRVNRQSKDEEFTLRSPTAIAGVRGTKFFTFELPGPDGEVIHGTCHCEGTVNYQAIDSKYTRAHNRDHIVLRRAGKVALLTPEDLSFMGAANQEHRHSLLDDSALGPKQVQLTPEQTRKLMEVAEKKFRAQK